MLGVALVAYNNVLNLWPPFNRWLFVPLNLTTTGLLAALALGPMDVGPAAMGSLDDVAKDALIGVAVASIISLPLFGVALRRPGAIADARVSDLQGPALAYQLFIRIPIGTALLEEFAFRGVLFAALERDGTSGLLWSSVVFALWHVSPGLNMARTNRPDISAKGLVLIVLLTIAWTFIAGIFLVSLRVRSDGLVLGWGLHAGVNSLATLAAVWSGRRVYGSLGPERSSRSLGKNARSTRLSP